MKTRSSSRERVNGVYHGSSNAAEANVMSSVKSSTSISTSFSTGVKVIRVVPRIDWVSNSSLRKWV